MVPGHRLFRLACATVVQGLEVFPPCVETMSDSQRQQEGLVVWFTGLSGSGKSTLAQTVAARLVSLGRRIEIVDGDDLRRRQSLDLGFSRRDREENVRRAACLARDLARRSDFVLVALIAPYRAIRAEIESQLLRYVEVFVNAPLSVCETRDPKGLYRRARSGQLTHFTGLDDPYEAPVKPHLECRTGEESIEESVQKVLQLLMHTQACIPAETEEGGAQMQTASARRATAALSASAGDRLR